MSDILASLWRDCADRTRKARADPRTTADVISAALATEEEPRWEFVVLLHLRATQEVLDAACRLCVSECGAERILGADILGQLGVPKRAFPDECMDILIALLEYEQAPEVLSSTFVALGHLGDARCVEHVLRFKNHPDDDVRYSVAYALAGHDSEQAIQALIELSEDSSAQVRDWATFALGSQTELDTPALREALVRRLHDDDSTTAGEAMVGLARRKDGRVLNSLLEELQPERLLANDEHQFAVEAAEELADPRLLPALRRVREALGDRIDVDDAIQRCEEGGDG